MPPKKRDKDGESSKNPRMDHIQADHELFLQAFEKPTQIYRFLRTRNMISPIFLNRTLSYMRQRMSRNHKNRRGFKVDSLLERIRAKRNENAVMFARYMTLTFLGFFDKSLESHPQSAQVETSILKVSHKKRKDSSSPMFEVSFGTNEVPINPSELEPPAKLPAACIPSESFCMANRSFIKSYILLLKVQYLTNPAPPPPAVSGNDSEEEPASKRRKSATAIVRPVQETKLYCSELTVYDKHNRCLLTDGDYELSLNEFAANTRSSPKKHSSWENSLELAESCDNLGNFTKGPSLKFKLTWSQEPLSGLVERPKPYPMRESGETTVPPPNNNNNNNSNGIKQEERLQIIYQFVYNNNSRQQTEACEDLHCPWCSVNCVVLYALLKHLKLCHSRFTFTYVPIPQGARVDVAINELYDGSYTGSPHDLISQPSGCAFSRNGPVRRASVTHILVCRPKRSRPSLSEFLELDDVEYDGQRPYITGHNRLYHHTNSCLPIYPKEMEMDSEDENDPEWLQYKTMMMIDEFTDVNEGEKELMKMWNLHVMKHGYVGDCQIPLACTMFLQARGRELLLNNLYRNFVLHLCSLFDFGLISPVALYNTVKKLQELVGETGAIRQVMQQSREAQRDNWGKAAVSQTPSTAIVPKTPLAVGRKAGPAGAGHTGSARRKGTPQDAPARRKSASQEHQPASSRKRLSLSMKKDDAQGKTISS